MQYKQGICTECDKLGDQSEKTIVKKLRSRKLCDSHNKRRLRKKKRRKKATGELEMFKEIYQERGGRSEISGEPVKFDVRCFAHILSKGSHPRFRLYKENVVIMTPDEHNDFDCSARDSRFDHILEKAQKLKAEYYDK